MFKWISAYKTPFYGVGMSWYTLKNQMEDNESKKITMKKDRKFLEALASDKYYLEGLIKKISLPNKSKAASSGVDTNLATQLIVSEAGNALGFLQDRREFWSQQKPDYPSKTKEKMETTPAKWNAVQNRVKPKKPNIFTGRYDKFS